MWPQAAHYPVSSLEPGYGLVSLFLGSSQVLGSLGTEPSSACSDLAYHLLPSSHPIPHSHTQMPSKASAGAVATHCPARPPHKLPAPHRLTPDTNGSVRGLFLSSLSSLPPYWFPSPMYPRPLRTSRVLRLTHAFSLHAPDRNAPAFLCPLKAPPASCLFGLCEHRV